MWSIYFFYRFMTVLMEYRFFVLLVHDSTYGVSIFSTGSWQYLWSIYFFLKVHDSNYVVSIFVTGWWQYLWSIYIFYWFMTVLMEYLFFFYRFMTVLMEYLFFLQVHDSTYGVSLNPERNHLSVMEVHLLKHPELMKKVCVVYWIQFCHFKQHKQFVI